MICLRVGFPVHYILRHLSVQQVQIPDISKVRMDGDENDSESLKKFLEDVKVTAKNGIVLNGALAWVDIQSHTTAV